MQLVLRKTNLNFNNIFVLLKIGVIHSLKWSPGWSWDLWLASHSFYIFFLSFTYFLLLCFLLLFTALKPTASPQLHLCYPNYSISFLFFFTTAISVYWFFPSGLQASSNLPVPWSQHSSHIKHQAPLPVW